MRASACVRACIGVKECKYFRPIKMAPALSKLAQNQSAIVGAAGMTAALWIIAYGKISNNKRYAIYIYI